MPLRCYALIFFLIVSCVSCRLGPRYAPPCTDVPEEWKNKISKESSASFLDGEWWEVFEDERLNYLERQAIENSPNLFVALDRVAEARALAGIDRAALYPQLTLNPSYSNMGILTQAFIPPGLVPPTDKFERFFRIHQRQYNLPLNLSYELDLWGKLRGQYDSDRREVEAQVENFYNALLTLTTDVATHYFQLRLLDTQEGLLLKNLTILEKNFAIAQSRFDKGLTSLQEVVSAEQELANTRATYYDVVRQRGLQENILSTLLGTPAPIFRLEKDPLVSPPPVIPAGIPSTILVQRPDIAAAERHMAAQHALIGVAYASFFPSFDLTGTLGFSSPNFKDFLTWKSRLWAIGVDAAQTVFDAGRNRSNLNLAYANYHETFHQYQQAVLTALQEVEDALVNVELQEKVHASYVQSVLASRKRLGLAMDRYSRGLVNYLEVLDSERTLIQAELNEANLLGLQYIAAVQLIKALGGSWCQERLKDEL